MAAERTIDDRLDPFNDCLTAGNDAISSTDNHYDRAAVEHRSTDAHAL